MSTKRLIADQILIKLSGGNPDVNFPVQKYDLFKRIEQKCNALFKMQQFSINLPSGETVPDNLAVATYEDVEVVSSGLTSYAILPVMPISLPRNAGISMIYDPANPDNAFIPIIAGQRALLKTDALLSDLLGHVSFEPKGKKIWFSRDLTLMEVSAVTMELVTLDISQYSETDMLPIPSDFEDAIVMEIYKECLAVQPEAGLVNPYTNEPKNAKP
jgi:hypothetical protein